MNHAMIKIIQVFFYSSNYFIQLQYSMSMSDTPVPKVVNSGGTATMNCTWSGWPAPRLEWLHDGTPVRAGAAGRLRVLVSGAQLVVPAVRRADQGVYQCVARSERDSAQASAELRLGGSQYFIGAKVSVFTIGK